MGSYIYVCLLVLTASVYYANSQPQRQPPQTNTVILGTGNTPQGGSGHCPLNQQAQQMCSDFCTRRGCQPRPCTKQTAFHGCRCWNCQRPNMRNKRYWGSFDSDIIPDRSDIIPDRSDVFPDRSDVFPDRSDMLPDWYY